MKLHFEDNLDYQLDAIHAVADIFKGQERNTSLFSVSKTYDKGMIESDKGIGNRLELLDDELLENLNYIQLRNGLRPTESLISGDFTVEMETGTGKTYVYLRTIFELNKQYGFTKFVIVVPSVPIKEGVYKTLQITRDHFENLYPESKGYDYFFYDSSKMGQVRNFATSPNVQIMIVTVGAINKKDVNNLYKESEKTGGDKPIDLVKNTHPVIIVDEPQSVDGGLKGQGKKALEAMNPLCTLRYSATHVDKHHMVYRLDAVDAYEKQLVKQIEIASLEIDGGYNKPYVKLISTQNKRGVISAKIEVHIQSGKSVRPEVITVQDGDDLEQETGRAIYENFRIGTINCGKGNQSIELNVPNGEYVLYPDDEIGGANQDDIKRLMIRRTIKEHLDKELRFAVLGHRVKVLSLFFIDKVEFYRQYDTDGNENKGKYAKIFEEEYRKLAHSGDYHTLFKGIDLESDASEVHNGYFSIDKKGKLTDTIENESNQVERDNAERAYSLIMRDKEKLLSFESKLKFIFSHSALREGWDNPNVFQICVLRDMGTKLAKRQSIGRGLRLCVNQDGQRLRGFDVNTLTVIASESYELFAEALQKEIEEDAGIRFGVIEKHQFANIPVQGADKELHPLGFKKSEELWHILKDKEFIDKHGKVQDILRTALKEKQLELPEEFNPELDAIYSVLRKLAGRLDIKNADDRITIKPNKARLLSPEFQELWERIKHKTTYRVDFDNEKLIQDCAKSILEGPPIPKTRARFRNANLAIGEGGIEANEKAVSQYTTIDESDIQLPDILTDLQDKTQLTRKSIVRILTSCRRLNDFKRNPQEFIQLAAEAINRTKRLALVEGIKYRRIGDGYYYAQELFEKEELTGYLKNTVEVQKSVYERVVYDSAGVEQKFAQALEKNESVKVYAKLPGWFKVPTPLGTYTPDWAVLVEKDGHEKLYLVVETKGSLWWDDLRHREGAKIKCGKEHFAVLAECADNPARFIKAKTVEDILSYD